MNQVIPDKIDEIANSLLNEKKEMVRGNPRTKRFLSYSDKIKPDIVDLRLRKIAYFLSGYILAALPFLHTVIWRESPPNDPEISYTVINYEALPMFLFVILLVSPFGMMAVYAIRRIPDGNGGKGEEQKRDLQKAYTQGVKDLAYRLGIVKEDS